MSSLVTVFARLGSILHERLDLVDLEHMNRYSASALYKMRHGVRGADAAEP